MKLNNEHITRDKGVHHIEIELHSLAQLFNTFDPAPFHEKELDDKAEEYIYESVEEVPEGREVDIRVYLPPSLVTPENRDAIDLGIRNHFSYREMQAVREQRRHFRVGRVVFLIGGTVLFFSLLARQVLIGFPESYINHMVQEALLIIGWVAMWQPVSIFLYDWWPILYRRKIYRRIAGMAISVMPSMKRDRAGAR